MAQPLLLSGAMRFLVAVLLLAGCGAGGDPKGSASSTRGDSGSITPLHAQFVADPIIGAGEEAYVCYSFDLAGMEGLRLGGVSWHPPSGAVVLHHASLFAAAELPDIGEVPCDPMPDRVAALGVYTPGAVPLKLPHGVAISLPPGTGRLVVLAHVMRVADGPAEPTSIDLEIASEPVDHLVNWVDVFAPVPVIPPHDSVHAVRRCKFDLPAHAVTVWPHMHRFGKAFHGAVVRSDGSREPLVDLDSWDFNHQLTYPVDIRIDAGDSVETGCYWEN